MLAIPAEINIYLKSVFKAQLSMSFCLSSEFVVLSSGPVHLSLMFIQLSSKSVHLSSKYVQWKSLWNLLNKSYYSEFIIPKPYRKIF